MLILSFRLTTDAGLHLKIERSTNEVACYVLKARKDGEAPSPAHLIEAARFLGISIEGREIFFGPRYARVSFLYLEPTATAKGRYALVSGELVESPAILDNLIAACEAEHVAKAHADRVNRIHEAIDTARSEFLTAIEMILFPSPKAPAKAPAEPAAAPSEEPAASA